MGRSTALIHGSDRIIGMAWQKHGTGAKYAFYNKFIGADRSIYQSFYEKKQETNINIKIYIIQPPHDHAIFETLLNNFL